MPASCVVFAVPGNAAWLILPKPWWPMFALPSKQHRSVALSALLAALGMAAACSHNAVTTVTLGAAGPLDQLNGIVTKQGPDWAGRRHLEILFADDSARGSRAAAIAQEFDTTERVMAVIGHVNSGAMVAAAHLYDKHLVAVATTATSPMLTGISPWTFRVIPSDSANAISLARFVTKLGQKRVAVLYENNAYGRGLAENFRKAYTGDIIGIDPIDDSADQNFEPYVSWFKHERADLVFVAGTDRSGLGFLKEARRQQLTAAIVGSDGWQALAPDPKAEGVYVTAPFSAQDPRPEVKAFVDAFQKRFHALPEGHAALAYDVTKMLAWAVLKVGPDRAKIRDFLANLTEATAFHGVTGVIRFRPDGDPVGKGMVLTRVHDGALQVEGGQ
jgi:branched-chain amino acid transport system substrate-binding protein